MRQVYELGVTPIEVKAGNRLRAKSLRVFNDRYKPKLSVILGGSELQIDPQATLWRVPLCFSEILKENMITRVIK